LVAIAKEEFPGLGPVEIQYPQNNTIP